MRFNFSKLSIFILLLLIAIPVSAAEQLDSPIHIELGTSKARYTHEEPIIIKIRIYNCEQILTESQLCAVSHTLATGQNIIGRDWRREILFTAPDGTRVRSQTPTRLKRFKEPLGAYRYRDREFVFASLVPKDWDKTYRLDARKHYTFSQYGKWKAQLMVPLYLFEYQREPISGRIFGFLPALAAYNPLKSNEVTFEVLPPKPIAKSLVNVFFEYLQIGPGTHPKLEKRIIEKAPIGLYRLSEIPEDYKPVNWKTYGQIVKHVKPYRSGVTDSQGRVKFYVEQDNYVAIGEYKKSTRCRYIGASARIKDPNWSTKRPINTYLRILHVANLYKPDEVNLLAGRVRSITNSSLRITEPEFVTWDDASEVYPFIFEGDGGWLVKTFVKPPPGIWSDNSSLTSNVGNGMDVLKFTLVSTWAIKDQTIKGPFILHRIPEKFRFSKSAAIPRNIKVPEYIKLPENFYQDNQYLTENLLSGLILAEASIPELDPTKWVETWVTYDILHGKEKHSIKSTIGLKLSAEWAKIKGLGIFGHSENQELFRGGKKIIKDK